MATTGTTTVYQYPYPLGGDSLSNMATRIKELADRSEIITTQIVSGSITLAPGTIYNANIAATAAISYSKLNLTGSITEADLAFTLATQAELDAHVADTTSVHGITNTANLVATTDTATVTNTMLAGSISPSKITGTAITAADTGTVTGTIIASSVALGGNPTTTTPTAADNTTKIATTAYVVGAVTGATLGTLGFPITKTADFTVGANENWLISNKTSSCVVTLPSAATARAIWIKNIAAFTVVSASSNVKPIGTNTAGTAILPATAGTWCTLVSDGTDWIVMQSGPGLFS